MERAVPCPIRGTAHPLRRCNYPQTPVPRSRQSDHEYRRTCGRARLRRAGRFEPCSLVPTEHTQRPERVPPTRLAHRLTEREGERLVVRAIEEAAPVGLLPALDDTASVRGAAR